MMGLEHYNLSSNEKFDDLMTVSTGVIDAYIIPIYKDVAMIIPQNIVLSALDATVDVKSIEWHEHTLPVYSVANPELNMGVALVIEGEQPSQRFALVCDNMPQGVRLRVSELVDSSIPIENPIVYQYVVLSGDLYQVPRLNFIWQLASDALKKANESLD